MNEELLKKKIQKEANKTTEEFQKREDVICRFENPIIAYINAEDVMFDALFARGMNDHPKKLYRPGKTIVAYYIPYAKDIVRANEEAKEPTEEWRRGWIESLWLAMFLNKTIIDVIRGQGRLTSYLNTMIEWNREKCSEPWSHKLAAVVGGFGEIGPAGSFHYNGSYGGRVGAIITDGQYSEPIKALAEEEIKEMIDKITKPCLYEGSCSEEMIKACPCGAISANGIDKYACQEYCDGFDSVSPAPEVCGKCFKFK